MSRETTTPYHPLALNPWNGGQNSYELAQAAIEERVDSSPDELLRTDERLNSFAKHALRARILDHSNANFIQYHRLSTALAEKGEAPDSNIASGHATPYELVSYLHANPSMESIESGRFTQAGERHIWQFVDMPIQDSLVQEGLDTTRIHDSAHYKLKQFDHENPSNAILDRKQALFSHFGGSILTVVRNTILMHDTNNDMPRGLRDYLGYEYKIVRSGTQDYAYDRVPEAVYAGIEKALTMDPPSSAIPLSTTYYSYRQTEN